MLQCFFHSCKIHLYLHSSSGLHNSKFHKFSTNIFPPFFSPCLTVCLSAGKPLSKCGKCARYMKLISARPTRLYCPSCEEVLALPQGGTIKLYKGLACPLDSYELVSISFQLFSMLWRQLETLKGSGLTFEAFLAGSFVLTWSHMIASATCQMMSGT